MSAATNHQPSPIDTVLSRLDGVRERGNGWMAQCPAHDDPKSSLSINVGKDGETVLLNCFAGCKTADIAKAAGFELRDLFPPKVTPLRSSDTRQPRAPIVAKYDYIKDGELRFQVQRRDDKTFLQRRPDGKGDWLYTMKGVERCLYHHDEVIAGPDPVYLVEGEKDADRLRSLGLNATTIAGGAKAPWLPVYTASLASREIVALADNDDPGREAARSRATALHAAECTIKMSDLTELWPDLPERGDISDVLDVFDDLTGDDLRDFASELPTWEPPQEEEKVSAAPNTEDAAERNALFLTARELAAQTPAETQWVAKPWVARDAITELSGKIKAAGKTTFTLGMCHSIVTGKPFLGFTPEKGPVVFLTEQPLASFRQALERANLLDCDDFHILQWHKTNGMTWPDVVVAARLYANEVGAVLMVVDTLAQFAGLRGDAENNAGAALEAIAPLQMALADGIGILLTRHDRKGGGEVGDSARGSSAFAGAVDVVLQIQRGEGNSRPTIRVINALSRFSETPDQLMIELTENGYIALGDKSAVAFDEARGAIAKVAPTSEADAALEKDLLEAAEVKRTVGQEALHRLMDERVIVRIGEGKRGNPYRYWKPGEKVSAATTSYSAAERNEHFSEDDEKVSAATTGAPAERNWDMFDGKDYVKVENEWRAF